jgi:hypothetical protein
VLTAVGWKVTILTTSSKLAKPGSITHLLVRIADTGMGPDRRKRTVAKPSASIVGAVNNP